MSTTQTGTERAAARLNCRHCDGSHIYDGDWCAECTDGRARCVECWDIATHTHDGTSTGDPLCSSAACADGGSLAVSEVA